MPAGVAGVVEQRILEAYAPVSGRGAITGWASLRLLGAAFFDGLAGDGLAERPVAVVEGLARVRASARVRPCKDMIDDADVVVRHGIRCARAEVSLLNEIAHLRDLRESVVAIDMACAGEVTSLRRLGAFLRSRPGARGVALADRAAGLAAEGSASPQESRFRLIWQLDAGWWPRPLVNRAVFDTAGNFLGKPDLLDPIRGIVGEYAGADHRSRERHRKDVSREDLFRRAGLEYVEVVGADLHQPEVVVGRMGAAEARAGVHRWTWRLGPAPESLDDVLDQHDAMVALAQWRD